VYGGIVIVLGHVGTETPEHEQMAIQLGWLTLEDVMAWSMKIPAQTESFFLTRRLAVMRE